MQVTYKTADGRLTFTFDATNDKEVFARIGSIQELYEDGTVEIDGEEVPETDVRYRCRTVGKFSFPEKFYKGNNAALRGYYKAYSEGENGLYPKRKDKDGNWLPNGGWTKWEGNQGEEKVEEQPKAKFAKTGAKTNGKAPF
jgi:hypothetical protein